MKIFKYTLVSMKVGLRKLFSFSIDSPYQFIIPAKAFILGLDIAKL